MTFGEQIAALRKRKGISQGDLGKAVGTSGDIIGKYERDEVKPSVEVASKIADVLEVSLDFLLGKTSLLLDKKTLKRLQDIEKLPENDKQNIFYTLDNLIKAAKLKLL
ncbi:MAG: helix-turn-helix domain-containing protein [Bacteroidota bacterium]